MDVLISPRSRAIWLWPATEVPHDDRALRWRDEDTMARGFARVIALADRLLAEAAEVDRARRAVA